MGFDPYHDGHGGVMEFDFNDDRTWAAIVMQNVWHQAYGAATDLGLYKTTVYPSGQAFQFGWADRLGNLTPRIDFSTDVSELYYGAVSPDRFIDVGTRTCAARRAR